MAFPLMVPVNVVELEDSDEDDIQILEEKLRQEGGTRRIFFDPGYSNQKNVSER